MYHELGGSVSHVIHFKMGMLNRYRGLYYCYNLYFLFADNRNEVFICLQYLSNLKMLFQVPRPAISACLGPTYSYGKRFFDVLVFVWRANRTIPRSQRTVLPRFALRITAMQSIMLLVTGRVILESSGKIRQ